MRETFLKTKKTIKFYENTAQARFKTFRVYNSLITSLCIEYIDTFMTLNLKDTVMLYCLFFYKLTPQMIKLNTINTDSVPLPAFGDIGAFISSMVNPIIKV